MSKVMSITHPSVTLETKERDLILAALRHWQDNRYPHSEIVMEIATNDDQHPCLRDDEIDDLCEEINQQEVTMFYRFRCGSFVEAKTFEEAKIKFIAEITNEKERSKGWFKCTCTGFDHRFGCPEKSDEIPY